MQEEFNIDTKKSLYNKFFEMKKGTGQTLIFIDLYCDYFEKYKNLILWEEPKMTALFSVALIVAFVIVTFLPLRFFIFASYTWRFYKGRKFQVRRQRNNREICRIELQNLFDDEKIKVDLKED